MLVRAGSGLTDKKTPYFNRLERLYAAKLAQLLRLGEDRSSLRFLVLQAEADAICQEMRHISRN